MRSFQIRESTICVRKAKGTPQQQKKYTKKARRKAFQLSAIVDAS